MHLLNAIDDGVPVSSVPGGWFCDRWGSGGAGMGEECRHGVEVWGPADDDTSSESYAGSEIIPVRDPAQLQPWGSP